MRLPLLPALLALPVITGHADETAKRLTGMVDAGYISSMGSTGGSKETFHGKLAVTLTGDYWVNILSAEGISTRDNIPATNDTERYLLNYKARHYFNPRDFFTFRAQWEKDLLSANDYQDFVSLGLGREILKNEHHFLKVEFGPGIRHTQPAVSPSENNAMGLLSWDYNGKISETSHFIHKGTLEAGEDSVITRVSNQFKQNITKVVALTVSHDYRHENSKKNTRSGVFSVGLNYQF